MKDNHSMARCKQCDHLLSFHGEDGCGTWLLGVRAVPLYRCACVVSVSSKPKSYPTIPTVTHEDPAVGDPTHSDEPKAQIVHLQPTSKSAPANSRERLLDVAAELRRTAEELKQLENLLDQTLKRLSPSDRTAARYLQNQGLERRRYTERRQKNFAMTADRRTADRRAQPVT